MAMSSDSKAKHVIITGGTSVLGWLRRQEVDPNDACTQLTKKQIRQLVGDAPGDASAELANLVTLEVSDRDRAVLLATDSDDGVLAATIVARMAGEVLGCSVDVTRVEAFSPGDPARLRREGLTSLIDAIDGEVQIARREGRAPYLCIGGGINVAVAYAAVYAMIKRVPIVFTFESRNVLAAKRGTSGEHDVGGGGAPKPVRIFLPALPVDFDWQLVGRFHTLLREAVNENGVPEWKLRQVLGEVFDRAQGLFVPSDAADGVYELSPFGMLFLEEAEDAAGTRVYISPSVEKTLQSSGLETKIRVENLLSKMKIPHLRSLHMHSFQGTDLLVFKPGNTAERVAYWESPSPDGASHDVYVAEVYTDHDRYEMHLRGRKQSDYDPDQFKEWVPSGTEASEDSVFEELDAVMRRRLRECETRCKELETRVDEHARRVEQLRNRKERAERMAREEKERARRLDEALGDLVPSVCELLGALGAGQEAAGAMAAGGGAVRAEVLARVCREAAAAGPAGAQRGPEGAGDVGMLEEELERVRAEREEIERARASLESRCERLEEERQRLAAEMAELRQAFNRLEAERIVEVAEGPPTPQGDRELRLELARLRVEQLRRRRMGLLARLRWALAPDS